ncbi:hypothetical protein [Dokdonia pacifica]|uniref:Uncharacterized protein n=1 Tax=Dokdonia pacifica TaxID=1627892 RepID=A0A239BZT0_9FLAO|nr:hypothetical protein [Dokdonia pacifica]SNS12931.1 hypothetical protein SAMN06265376_10723 [Dokdonia pacifica]
MNLLSKHSIIYYILIICITICSCSNKGTTQDPNIIYLKWNKSYPKDALERNKSGLKWALSFLGSTIALDTTLTGITHNNDIIKLDVSNSGFTKKAIPHLQELNRIIQNSEEYQKRGHIDMGRYVALTIGSSNHYYKIVDTPLHLYDLEASYTFDTLTAFINNSGISHIDREIQYSINNKPNRLAFISAERDTVTGEIQEYETVELMPNGHSRFALYDIEGNLKTVGDKIVTRAGKPAKCMWCHESNIQPLFSKQLDVVGYIPSNDFLDSLKRYNNALKKYQREVWRDSVFLNRRLHTEMEIAYIKFMEPSIEQLANEWQLSQEDVLKKVAHLKSHRHHEFDFLGDLYHRIAIDSLAPFKVLEVPESIREASSNENKVDYIK